MSKVVSNGNGRMQVPLNEPVKGKKKSQIDEYLEFYKGPGVQHIAIATDDIVATVRTLRDRGGRVFAAVPGTYYDTVLDRVGQHRRRYRALARPSASSWWIGTMKATCSRFFSKPVQDRPTLFYEVIQRKGAKSFGAGNFKALSEGDRSASKRVASRNL